MSDENSGRMRTRPYAGQAFEAFWAGLPAWRRGVIARAIEKRERKGAKRVRDLTMAQHFSRREVRS